MRNPDVFSKCLALKPGEILELSKADAREFFNWTFPHGDVPRERAAVLGFLKMFSLKMDRNEQHNCWRVCK